VIVARYRLRFLLHELDLPLGETMIGRSSSCGVTLDDPLISRNHARIFVQPDVATIEDLGSRNGVRVNGRSIQGAVALNDGDRLRIGTQQLLFRRLEENAELQRTRRATGFLVHCPDCDVALPANTALCPHCGAGAGQPALGAVPAEAQFDSEERTSTVQAAWSLELIVDTLRRAQLLGRSEDVERILVRAREQVTATRELVDRRRLDQLADAALQLSAARNHVEWARWALSLYAMHGVVPRPEVGVQLSQLPEADRSTLAADVDQVMKSLRPDAIRDPIDQEAMRTLRVLAVSGKGGVG
jgi:FHA domain